MVDTDVAEWRDLLARHAAVNCALERELAGEVHLSQSALSRVIARLEKAGLVERTMCVEDRRGIFVKLTPAGAERHAAAQATHRQVLADHLH
jgi:DNA-binding MarR family transcriptional regulator